MIDVMSDEDRVHAALLEMDRPRGGPESDLVRAGRRNRVFLAISVVLAVGAVGVVLAGVLPPGAIRSDGDDVPVWQQVAGWFLCGAGFALQMWGVLRQLRANRRLRAWSSPLFVLTRSQRRSLTTQVRGRRSVEPETLPLARLTAESLVAQRFVFVNNFGLSLFWTGMWLVEPAPFRAVLVTGLALVVLGPGLVAERDARRAQRFLAGAEAR